MSVVLIVDDNEENLYLLDALLRGNGHVVIKARNGSEALQQALKQLPDLVISDILMPVMDGFALCREWKMDTTFRNTPFVFYTATYTDPKDEELALSLGADRFIVKPQEPEAFMKIIMEVIATFHHDGLLSRFAPGVPEAVYLKEYNAALIRKLEHKVEQLDEANKALAETISEKEILLRELFHRTKNNMQVISSILSLQASSTSDTKVQQLVRDTDARIKTISLVHQKLYQSQNLSKIDLQEYLNDLADSLINIYVFPQKRITLELDIKPAWVSFDVAVPFSIVVYELISNALKHAFPAEREGEIRLRFTTSDDGDLSFSITDNGVGVPANFDFTNSTTLGFQIIRTVVEHQLRGSLKFEAASGRGVSCTIRFKNH